MYDNLKLQFSELNKAINQSLSLEDYSKALELIRKANEICKRMYEESTSVADKEFWKKNNFSLKKLANHCKENLKEQGIVLEVSKPKEVKSISKNEDSHIDSKNNEEINYFIDDIDVRQFLISDGKKDTTFDDVCGMEEEKKFIENEFFLNAKERSLREELGIDNENFLLLYGVPGTGKTFFATAISNELKKRNSDVEVHFFAVKSPNIKDSKVGATEKNIQAIFEFSKQFERCVLFFDEFEAIVPSRNINTGDPTAKTSVATFLQLIEGFSSNDGILIIAATNYPEQIDTAILSRAKEKIEVPLPNKETIYQILKKGLGDWLEDSIDLDELSEKMIGYSGRDLKHFIQEVKKILFNEIKTANLYESKYTITKTMLEKALEKIKPVTLPKDIKRISAFKK